jgi:predicted DNA-binding protein (UPF0251 family)
MRNMAGPKTHPDTLRALEYVEQKGFTVAAAASLVGIHRSTLSRALNKRRNKKRGNGRQK